MNSIKRFFVCCGCALVLMAVAKAATGPSWSSFPRTTAPGKFGIALADLEGNGFRRIVASAFETGFSAAAGALVVYDDASGALEIEQLIHFGRDEPVFGRLQLYRLPGSNRDLIGVSVGSQFVTFGDWPLRKISSVPLPSAQTQVTSIYDVDGDGVLELLGLTEPFKALDLGSPFVASSIDGSLHWNDTGLEAHDVAAGHLGSLAQSVIVISTFNGPQAGIVLSGATRQTLWSWPEGFHGKIQFGNYSGDSTKEFAVSAYGGETRIFHANPAFSLVQQYGTAIGYIREIFDLNGDGYDDFLVSDTFNGGSIKGFDGLSGTQIYSLNNPDPGVSAISVGRLGHSAAFSLVHGAGIATSGRDVLRVVDLASSGVVHLLDDELGPHSASTILRRAGGHLTVAYATRESRAEFRGSAIYLLDMETGETIDSVLPDVAIESRSDLKLIAANIDADAQDELISYSDRTSMGYVSARDGETLDLQWERRMPDFAAVTDAFVADIDANGSMDVVVSSGGHVHVLDGGSGEIVWTSIRFTATGESTLAFGVELTAGGAGISYVKGDRMYVIDPVKRVVDRVISLTQEPMQQSVEVSGGGCEHRLFYGDRIEGLNCLTGAVERTRVLATNAMMVRLLADLEGPILISDGQRVLVQAGDAIVKQSARLDVDLGFDNQGAFLGDIDNGLNVFVGGVFGFYRLDFGPEIFLDGFEDK